MEVQPAPVADTAVGVATATATSAASTAPGVQGASSPSQAQQSNAAGNGGNGGLAPAIAKLFGAGAPQPIELNVSYRIEGNDVVTVFSDPKTGKEIAQFPPELLLGLAKFFDQQAGVTFDKNA